MYKYKITLNNEYLSKINVFAYEIEKDGFFIHRIDYWAGWIFGNCENPERFKKFKFIKSIELTNK